MLVSHSYHQYALRGCWKLSVTEINGFEYFITFVCRHDIVLLGLELSTADGKRNQLHLCRCHLHEISVSHNEARFTFYTVSLIPPYSTAVSVTSL